MMAHDKSSNPYVIKARTSSSRDQFRVAVRKEKWLQGYCSAQLLQPQEHAGPLRSLL